MCKSLLRRLPWADLKYALWVPAYLLTFVVLEHIPLTAYWSTQLPLDGCIPFREEFVVFYCLWYPLLVAVGVYLLARDREAFRRYMRFLALTFFVSELIWVLLPNGQDLRPVVMPRENLFTAIVSALYRIDPNTNVFPSVHVVGAVGAALAVWDCRPLRQHRAVRWTVLVLSALICLSTLFVKQHALLDVVGGLGLSLLAALPVYCRRPALRPCREDS